MNRDVCTRGYVRLMPIPVDEKALVSMILGTSERAAIAAATVFHPRLQDG